MKYIKSYEAKNETELYWKIPIEKYYMEAALRKIGVPNDKIKYWTENVSTQFKTKDLNNGKVYVFDNPTDEWIWESLSYAYFNDNTIYKGEIIPTPEEVEEEKLREKSDKYNI